MSMLKVLNLFLIQWLFVRLARVTESDGRTNGWCLIGPVLPLTGLWSRYIGRARPLVWFRRPQHLGLKLTFEDVDQRDWPARDSLHNISDLED